MIRFRHGRLSGMSPQRRWRRYQGRRRRHVGRRSFMMTAVAASPSGSLRSEVRSSQVSRRRRAAHGDFVTTASVYASIRISSVRVSLPSGFTPQTQRALFSRPSWPPNGVPVRSSPAHSSLLSDLAPRARRTVRFRHDRLSGAPFRIPIPSTHGSLPSGFAPQAHRALRFCHSLLSRAPIGIPSISVRDSLASGFASQARGATGVLLLCRVNGHAAIASMGFLPSGGTFHGLLSVARGSCPLCGQFRQRSSDRLSPIYLLNSGRQRRLSAPHPG